ncbi:MAG: AMP-binding protein, partial [Candidatus Binatia bacterium]
FTSQAERTPEAVAVVVSSSSRAGGNHPLTYRELNQRANQLARYLVKLGAGPEVLVALCIERSLEAIIAILAILKAGGAYLPLDPEYPRERLAFMLEDSGAQVLLTQERLLSRLPEMTDEGGPSTGEDRIAHGAERAASSPLPSPVLGLPSSSPQSEMAHAPCAMRHATVICLDKDWELIAHEPDTNLSVGASAENLAYVIYTSGSTGKPKGVAVPHKAVNRLVINTDYIDVRSTDIVAQAANCSFDAATFEIWGALLHGARLVVIATDVALSPGSLAAELREKHVTVLFLTTALFNQAACEVPAAFREVRCLMFGGEAVDPKWVGEILKHGPPERLLHVYGPTETTTFASWYPVENIPEKATTVPIGRPIANTTIYILDGCLRPVPIGVVGELH